MADELKPYALRVDVTTAAGNTEAAGEVFDRIEAGLPEGVFLEGGLIELMDANDVIADSPLSAALGD